MRVLMKVLTGFMTAALTLASALVTARAQQQSLPPPPPQTNAPEGVTVVKQSWSKELIPGWENRGQGAEPFDVMIQRVTNERQLEQARNAGRKGEAARRERDAQNLKRATGVDPKKSPSHGESSRFGYKYKVSLRNGGAKEIKSVDWDYVFRDPATGAEVSRHQFTSDEKIRPGKEKELSVFVLSPPSRTVSAAAGGKSASPFDESVVIVRVLYADGSVWEQQ